MALIFRKEAVTRLPCFATPPQFRSIHARKVWQIYVRRFDARITISTRPRAVPKTGPNIQIFVKRRGNWPKSVAHATRLPDFVLVQGISIANEITGTYRSGIRPDVGFRPRDIASPLPLLIGRRPNTKTRIARQRVCGRIVSPPKFRSASGPKTSDPLVPILFFSISKNILPISRHLFFTLYTIFPLFLLCFIQLGNLNSLGEVM